jgi:uncharacterized membrane protein
VVGVRILAQQFAEPRLGNAPFGFYLSTSSSLVTWMIVLTTLPRLACYELLMQPA